MTHNLTLSPWRVLLPISLGTSLSLFGDASLYAVLPTHVNDAGVALASIGILLSANRFIRLLLNSPVGWLYDHYPRRYLFVLALFIGAGSTAIYALTLGFWPLLVGRLLWGLAWAGIWVGGNTIILDISQAHNRGRWVGIYQISFFLGVSGGAILGGLVTDWLGYHQAMGLGALLTLLGAIIALLFLPETRDLRKNLTVTKIIPAQPVPTSKSERWSELLAAFALLGMNRLLLAGILVSTFGLFVLEQVGDSLQIAQFNVGIATLTGFGLGMNSIISMFAAPMMGSLSDRLGNRWRVVSGGLIPGVAGFGLLTVGSPVVLLLGISLIAISGGGNQSLSTALIGDLSTEAQHGRRLGILFTVGDLTSAVGPPLAYSLIPQLGLKTIYLLSAGGYLLMFFIALYWIVRSSSGRKIPGVTP